jgi:hypothetical protein
MQTAASTVGASVRRPADGRRPRRHRRKPHTRRARTPRHRWTGRPASASFLGTAVGPARALHPRSPASSRTSPSIGWPNQLALRGAEIDPKYKQRYTRYHSTKSLSETSASRWPPVTTNAPIPQARRPRLEAFSVPRLPGPQTEIENALTPLFWNHINPLRQVHARHEHPSRPRPRRRSAEQPEPARPAMQSRRHYFAPGDTRSGAQA